jgi:hypothetical protein
MCEYECVRARVCVCVEACGRGCTGADFCAGESVALLIQPATSRHIAICGLSVFTTFLDTVT